VIASELYRNLLLALICVSITTLILLANWKAALFVIVCVLFTLVSWGHGDQMVRPIFCHNFNICNL
jgi:multidrug efflux pump subunit AcrB